MTAAITPPAWMDAAVCAQVDPYLFFPDMGDSSAARQARALCRSCPVVELCAEYATTHHLDGIWGDTGPRDRKRRRGAA